MTTLVAAIAVVALIGGSASAQYPPATEGSTAVSDATVAPGEPFTVSGSGWQPGSTVTITLFSDPVVLGTAPVSAAGTFSTQVEVPSSVSPGSHTLQVSGTGADGEPRTTSTRIVVTGAGAGGGRARAGGDPASGSRAAAGPGSGADGFGTTALAATGLRVAVGATLAAALLALGAGAVLATRRRVGVEQKLRD